jgi:uncharacterized protein (DUF2384 family)
LAGVELAQAVHVQLQRVHAGLVVQVEQAVEQGLLGHRAALLEHQGLQQRALARRQRQRRAGQRELARLQVVAQVAAQQVLARPGTWRRTSALMRATSSRPRSA